MDSTVFQLISNVNDLYSNIITYTFALVGLIGIIIPVIVAWIQRKMIVLEEKKIEDKLSKSNKENIEKLINEKFEALDEKFKTETDNHRKTIDSKLESFEKDTNIKFNNSMGAIFLLQGNNALSNKEYMNALRSFVTSINYYMNGSEEHNLQSAITNLFDILTFLYKEDLESDIEIENKFSSLLESLEEININDRYTHTISKMKTEFNKTKNRVEITAHVNATPK